MNDRLAGATVAVVGFGNQGAAQAHLLRAAGLDVVVGARPGGPSESRARADGFRVGPPAEVAASARLTAVLIPDEAVPDAWPPLARAFPRGCAVVFAHGFSLCYGGLDVPPEIDVVLASPTGPGRIMRPGPSKVPVAAYLAVHQDATGHAWEVVEAYARRLGCEPVWRTTVREETEVDLFGEQVVLCGGMNALVRAAFEVLVERGYAPEMAYLECVHQLKYLADLLHERGVDGLRRGISSTALYGDLTRGPRVIGAPSRAAMEEILEEIRSGAFAREWLAEVARGRPTLGPALEAAARHPIESARRSAVAGRASEAD